MKEKNRLVIKKNNELVRNAINKFDYKQNQLMCALLGKYVHTKDDFCIDTTISIDEFRSILDIKSDGGNAYKRIKNAIDKFAENNNVGIFDSERNKYIWRPFFKEIELNQTSVRFVWNDAMKNDLVGLKKKFTAYLANDYMKLNSVYSQNLYEQMKSYENMPKRPQVTFTTADLHRIMQTEKIKNYQTFNKFKTKCIVPAINDINEKTDIFIEIEVVRDKKDKRKAIGLAFTIRPKYEFFNYNGCWLNADQINDIIYNHYAKHKIIDLGQIKKENSKYYTLLRQGNKSDYEIILNFIKQDVMKKEKENNDFPDDDEAYKSIAELRIFRSSID